LDEVTLARFVVLDEGVDDLAGNGFDVGMPRPQAAGRESLVDQLAVNAVFRWIELDQGRREIIGLFRLVAEDEAGTVEKLFGVPPDGDDVFVFGDRPERHPVRLFEPVDGILAPQAGPQLVWITMLGIVGGVYEVEVGRDSHGRAPFWRGARH